MKMYSFLLICILLMGTVLTPAYGEELYTTNNVAEENSVTENVFFDAIILRPLGLAYCAAGLVGSVVTLPFAYASKSESKTYKTFIQDPFDFTFKRPFGTPAADYKK